MLIVAQYDVRLIRVQPTDLGLILRWRNSDGVRKNMFIQDLLQEKDQLTWFHSINNAFNYYFIIEYLGKKVGLIHAKNFSEEEGIGEGGIFIGENDYLETWASVMASICFLNFIFTKLEINRSIVRVQAQNKSAISYNRQLGYKIEFEDANEIRMVLDKADFFKKYNLLKSTLSKLSKGDDALILQGEKASNNLTQINRLFEN
ncbi:MAG: GNAT family N-acetyltransferase [Crocinitomicaceae bacterium]|nr:GNAT family N-acetyltransferase [Crocinitomicaceae bacterium]